MADQKQPPHNREAEEALLGSILINQDILLEVRTIIQTEDFFFTKNQEIYDASCALADQGKNIDLLTLNDALPDKSYGGPAYLTKLANAAPSSVHAASYADIVHKYGVKRRLLVAATAIAKGAWVEAKDHEELLAESQNLITEVAMSTATRGPVAIKEALGQHYDLVTEVQAGRVVSVPSGLVDLDKILAGGWKNTSLNVVAGVTGMGKTATMTTFARNVAVSGGTPVLFSLEQPTEQIVTRLIADKVGVPIDAFDIQDGLSQADLTKWHSAIADLEKVQFYIDDTPNQSVLQICNHVRRLKMMYDINVVFVDYLQLIQPSQSYRMRVLELADVMRHLHQCARETEIPFVLGAQISREVYNRSDKRPVLKDIRESGDIEQYSYTTTFLHRDDYWDPVTINKNVAELIVAKHRQGKTGTAKAIFMGEYSRLENAVFNPLGQAPSPIVTPPGGASI